MGVSTKIDWCDSTWNPVTGCLHGCEYCYARKIAERFSGFAPEENGSWNTIQYTIGGPRLAVLNGLQLRKQKDGKVVPAFYPFGFQPTFHRYKLDEPKRLKNPRTIFVCSMSDLFGWFVPDSWIQEVFDACEAAPWHRYMFLTKNPARYIELAQAGKLPNKENFWYGSSVTTKKSEFFYHDDLNTFVSIEPILEPFTDLLDYGVPAVKRIGWIIVGAETGNRKGKVVPDKSWIIELKDAAEECGVPIFMKESLRETMRYDFRQLYPWV